MFGVWVLEAVDVVSSAIHADSSVPLPIHLFISTQGFSSVMLIPPCVAGMMKLGNLFLGRFLFLRRG